MSDAKSFVDNAIASKKVVVFSKRGCPFCDDTKELVRKLGLGDELLVIEIDSLPNCSQIQDYLKNITGARTVPRVFINGKSIGGNSELQSINRSGQLKQLLQ